MANLLDTSLHKTKRYVAFYIPTKFELDMRPPSNRVPTLEICVFSASQLPKSACASKFFTVCPHGHKKLGTKKPPAYLMIFFNLVISSNINFTMGISPAKIQKYRYFFISVIKMSG